MIDNLLLGMQGWDHPDCVDSSKPVPLTSLEMLASYSQRHATVELDDTFYGVPPESVVTEWKNSVPADFTFALKAPQQITHERRFSDGGSLLRRFLDRVSRLGGNLGPILLLAPTVFERNESSWSALEKFVRELPSDFRWALELRHHGWFGEDLHDLLAKANVALVLGENRWVRRSVLLGLTARPTADFAYVRWNHRHASGGAARGGEHEERVTAVWVKTLERLGGLVGSIFGYFNINAFGDGARSLAQLQHAIGQQWLEASVSENSSDAEGRDAL